MEHALPSKSAANNLKEKYESCSYVSLKSDTVQRDTVIHSKPKPGSQEILKKEVGHYIHKNRSICIVIIFF